MPSSSRKKAAPRKRAASVRPRSVSPMETPIGAIITFALLWAGILLFLALVSYTPKDVPSWVPFSYDSQDDEPIQNFIGVLGAIVAGYHYFLFGAGSYLIAAGLCWFGLSRFVAKIPLNQRTIGGLALFVFAGASLAHLQPFFFKQWQDVYNIGPGGTIGELLGGGLRKYLGGFGAQVLLLPAYLLGLVLLTGFHPITFAKRFLQDVETIKERRKQARWEEADDLERLAMQEREAEKAVKVTKKKRRKSKPIKEEVEADEEEEDDDWEVVAENPAPEEAVFEGKPKKKRSKKSASADEPSDEESSKEEVLEEEPPAPKIIDGSARRPKRPSATPADATLPVRASFQGVSFEGYELPPLDLLNFEEVTEEVPTDQSFLIRNQNIIVETLGTFGLEVYPGDITRGPSITRYEIYPSKGLRVSRIVTLEPDIARATKAERINIIAPIPGKDTVGIEIANKDKVPVPLRELLDDEAFRDTEYKIPLALGKDVYGNAVLADLASMPHLLVAGATGSGKSVCINSIIASLLFQFSPEQLRFIMIDPKVVEMQIYNDLPHLVVPVVTDPKKVILALRWVVKEMERRYKLFADVGKRNFDAFNSRDRDKTPKKPARAPSRKKASSPPVTGDKETVVTDETSVTEETLSPNNSVAPTHPETEDVVSQAQEVIADVEEVIGVGASADDGDDETPPFFVHPVSMGGEDNDLAEELAQADRDAEEAAAEMEDEMEDDDLPPHEFATPEEPEIPDTLPYIVVIIDELADLMQTAPADVELAIGRITQMARAAGIHLIVATQTPRADVITGTIKANIPCRIAFQVASGIDSRVILDAKGADRLVGKGDMLYLPPGTSQLVRSQGALISDDEIQDLVEYCRKQGEPVYEQEVQDTLEGKHQSESQVSPEDEEILAKCLEVIRQEKRASTSLMQRRLGLGYTRAARMMDILEERGYVGPGEGAKPREILMDNLVDDTQY